MSLISKIFSSKPDSRDKNRGGGGKALPCALQPKEIDLKCLKVLIPIRNLDEDELVAFAADNVSEVFPPQSILFRAGEKDESVLYLLEGTVRMETECGRSYEIAAGSAKARFPLSSGRQHSGTAHAETDVRILRVSSRIMVSTNNAQASNKFGNVFDQPQLPEKVRNSQLFDAFCQYFGEEKLNLPTLPDVAVKLRNALHDEAEIDNVVKLVQLDPAIAAKLIQVANCPLYVAANPVSSCRDAVIRLGLKATRNLVTSLSIKRLFNCKNPMIQGRSQKLWKQSVHLSCLCFVLASETKSVNPEEALLAGLMADIGIIPFLQFTDDFPQNLYQPEEIDEIEPYIRGPAGAFLLRKWDFPDELVAIPEIAENWLYDDKGGLNLNDIVILSKLHSIIGSPRIAELPAINSIPACSKLEDGTLSPEHSLNVLHRANDRVKEAYSVFK